MKAGASTSVAPEVREPGKGQPRGKGPKKVEEMKRQRDGSASSEVGLYGLLCVVFLDYVYLLLDLRTCLEWVPTFPNISAI